MSRPMTGLAALAGLGVGVGRGLVKSSDTISRRPVCGWAITYNASVNVAAAHRTTGVMRRKFVNRFEQILREKGIKLFSRSFLSSLGSVFRVPTIVGLFCYKKSPTIVGTLKQAVKAYVADRLRDLIDAPARPVEPKDRQGRGRSFVA